MAKIAVINRAPGKRILRWSDKDGVACQVILEEASELGPSINLVPEEAIEKLKDNKVFQAMTREDDFGFAEIVVNPKNVRRTAEIHDVPVQKYNNDGVQEKSEADVAKEVAKLPETKTKQANRGRPRKQS